METNQQDDDDYDENETQNHFSAQTLSPLTHHAQSAKLLSSSQNNPIGEKVGVHLQNKIEELKEIAKKQQRKELTFLNKMMDYHTMDKEYMRRASIPINLKAK